MAPSELIFYFFSAVCAAWLSRLYILGRPFCYSGALLHFLALYTFLPAFLYISFGAGIGAQHLLIDGNDADGVLSQANQTAVTFLLVACCAGNKSPVINNDLLVTKIIPVLFAINILVATWTVWNVYPFIFNRDAAFAAYEKSVASTFVHLSKLYLIIAIAASVQATGSFRLWLYSLPVVVCDVLILGRTYMAMVALALAATTTLRSRLRVRHIVVGGAAFCAVFFLRKFFVPSGGDLWNPSSGNFEVAGEFVNTFVGHRLFSTLDVTRSFGDLMLNLSLMFRPLLWGRYLYMPNSTPEVLAMTANEMYEDYYGIYGLAGGAAIELMAYSSSFPFIIVMACLYGFVVRTASGSARPEMACFYWCALLTLPTAFRWSLLSYFASSLSALIFIFFPLFFLMRRSKG